MFYSVPQFGKSNKMRMKFRDSCACGEQVVDKKIILILDVRKNVRYNKCNDIKNLDIHTDKIIIYFQLL